MMVSVASVFCLLAILCLSYAIGSALTRRMSGWDGFLEKMVFAVPLGMGVVSYVVLAFGLLRLFRPPLFYGLLGLGVLSEPILIRDCLRARRINAPSTEKTRVSPFIALAIFAVAAIGACTLIAALAPPTEWDALSYHLAGPKTYLRAGRIFYIPYDHHTNFPFTLQMLYTLMLGVGSVGGAKLCHWLCGALITASVYTFAARHIAPAARGRRVGAIAAVILASTPMALWEATVAYTDLATALFTWLSLYALLNDYRRSDARESGKGRNNLILSAVFIGFALASKFTVLAFWGFLFVGFFIWPVVESRRVSPVAVQRAALWVGLSLLVAAPWYLKTWMYTGNPTYPFLYSIFGGRYWNAENAAQYARDQAHLGNGKSPFQLLIAPWTATMLPDPTMLPAARAFTEYLIFNLSPVYLAFLLALPLMTRRLSLASKIAGLFGLGMTLFWFFSVQQTRYLLPAFPAFAVVCAEVVTLFWEDGRKPEALASGLLTTLAACWGVYLAGGLAFWGVRDEDGHRIARPAWPVVSGTEDRDEYVERSVPGIGAAELWINHSTPPDAKIALFDLTEGFYLDRTYLWAQPDHAAGLIPYDTYVDTDDWLRDFKRRGYTYLLIGPRDPDAPGDGKRWRTLLADAVQSGKVTLVFSAPNRISPVLVYRIP